jgi:hypothetical protein
MLTPALVLLVVSLIFVLLNALGKGPLWPAVLCLILLHLIR